MLWPRGKVPQVEVEPSRPTSDPDQTGIGSKLLLSLGLALVATLVRVESRHVGTAFIS